MYIYVCAIYVYTITSDGRKFRAQDAQGVLIQE